VTRGAELPRKTELEPGLEIRGGGGLPRTSLDPDPGPSGGARPPGFANDPDRGATRLEEGQRKARVVGWMISFDFNDTGQEYVFREGRNLVGRDRDCDISLFYDNRVSGKHAIIVYRNGNFTIRDEMSTHGTVVNGEDIGAGQTRALVSGDVVRLGGCMFKVYLLDLAEVRSLWPSINAK
jgi:hypothetical protein